jgi:GT2 family glycosyltransferase
MSNGKPLDCGVVAIGRNEGERLKACVRSLRMFATIVYVDSGSTDGSVGWARCQGVDVVELGLDVGFTAARARNAGFNRLRELAPDVTYVQFVDGDCALNEKWPRNAALFLSTHADVCAVFGRRRERHPERSIYNRLCDHEWDVPTGEARAFGGDVMMRADALEGAGGYREDLVAGEEPELCVRLRAAGWSIWRLDHEMTLHDAAITRFKQWWLRHVRSGYAFANGAYLHGSGPERMWVWESRRALLWGLWLPMLCALAVLIFGLPGLAALAIYPLQLIRRARRMPGTSTTQLQFALFELLSRYPECVGQLKFARDRFFRSKKTLIEYK